MKLMMLGGRGVGKTTSMYAMYRHFMTPRSGLRLVAADTAAREELGKGAELLRSGSYPPATLRRDKYDFNLCHNGDEVFQFSWIDYSGRWLTQQGDPGNVEQLQRDLKECEGLFVFLEAEKFPAARNIELRQTIQILNGTLTAIEKILPVVFVITKCDSAPRGFDREYYEESLQPVLSNIARSTKVTATVTPIACGPRGRDEDMPLYFFLYLKMSQSHNEGANYVQGAFEAYQAYERRSYFDRLCDKIYSVTNGFPTDRQIVNRRIQSAVEMKAKMEKIRGALTAMGERINRMKAY
jgi:Double-GTPase 2